MSNVIPPGYYRAVAVPVTLDGEQSWAQFGRTKDGNPQVAILFAILDEGPWKGRRLTWFGYFTEKSVDRTVESLRLCGFKGDELVDLPHQVLDQAVSVTVEHSEYDGKKQVKIAWVNPDGGGMRMADPMKDADLRKFSAQFRGKVKAKPVVAGNRVEAPALAAASAAPSEPVDPPEDKGDDPWAQGQPAATGAAQSKFDEDIPF